MRAVVQRARRASVRVEGETIGEIGPGLVVLVGAGQRDSDRDVAWLVGKIAGMRIFRDDEGRMNRSVVDCGGSVLAISQFTLYGDCRKGRRPSFADALAPEPAQGLYDRFVAGLREAGLTVATGRFGAMMDVELINDGPVTLLLDSERRF